MRIPHCVLHPFPNVTCHVVRAEGSQPREFSDWRRSGQGNVALAHNVAGKIVGRGPIPLAKSRQTLTGKCGVSGGLVPTYSRDRIIALAFRIVPALPGRRAFASGAVAERKHGFIPVQLAAVLDKLLRPVLLVLVSTLIDEFLELAVRDLEAIQVIGRQIEWAQPAYEVHHFEPPPARHRNHSRRSSTGGVEGKIHRIFGGRSSEVFADSGL